MKPAALPLVTLASLVLAALVVSGCGRAGDPYTPSEGARIDAKEAGLPAPAAPVKHVDNPDKRFILDGLLE